ncbi:benzyl alcohol O-benzoyltransferase-like [Panicum miliaceum]|uniref:Benzyl alcohol O-benzoyltransferase-like n=1 Tax=Panicum miliaceum TaxID=4540 RepID=A0A3L6TCA4_PANMI|nr:benzyl alcohol O-benzoyltransferase-like [Panicum miliaceum]
MTIAFAVRRRDPELVGPARKTPRETKRLSDIEDQAGLRWHVPFVLFYRGRGGARADGGDPAAAVRRALGEALVPYYPLAGRLREMDGRKLVVDCTGEGVLFVEADADVRLAEIEAAGLTPPFPCMDQLLFDVEGSGGVLNCPLLLIQVTRLRCGGFVFALRLNHTMCDAVGIVQFMSAVGELARGQPAPTVAPVWSRETLDARIPPRPSFPHHEYDPVPPTPFPPPGDMVMRTFTFRPADVAAIKKGLPVQRGGKKATTFEALAALIWRARTAALEIPAGEDARLVVAAGVRGVRGLALPAGYYGNACVYPSAVSAAGALRGGPLGDAVALVRAAKEAAASAEFVRSTADLMALRGRPSLAVANMLIVSDNRHAGFRRVDLGWGKPVYGGPAGALFVLSFIVAVRNGDGEDAIAVPVVLPRSAMARFASEVDMLLKS